MPYTGQDRRKVKPRILIIDDDPDVLALYQKLADHVDVFLQTTSLASEFVELFNEGNFDVALVDYVMPIDGVVLSRLLKKDKNPNTKIYFITSHDEKTIINKINGDKYDGIFSKGVGFSKILSSCVEGVKYARV